MSRWFRVYDDLVNDPKVQRLTPDLFKSLINLWCLASKNGGTLPSIEDISFQLRITPDKVHKTLESLKKASLIDHNGVGFSPHNWDGRQFLSDSSAERVKRHRDKRSAAGLERQWVPSKELRGAVYERDDFACVYCGSADDLTIDHRIPERRGGTHDIENLQTACRPCNASKRDLTHDEFVARNADGNGNVTLLKRHQNTEQIQKEGCLQEGRKVK